MELGCFKRYLDHILHSVLLSISFLLIFIGFMSPRWQEIQFAVTGDVHHHGLWQDCMWRNRFHNNDGIYTCNLKPYGFGIVQYGYYDYGHHDNDPWRQQVLALLIIANLCQIGALIALFFNWLAHRRNNLSWKKRSSIIDVVLEICAIILCLSGMILFWHMAYDPLRRTIIEPGETVREEQQFGLSFYMSWVGLVFALLSLVIAAVRLYLNLGNQHHSLYSLLTTCTSGTSSSLSPPHSGYYYPESKYQY